MNYREIGLEDIREDCFFRFRDEIDLEPLTLSIAECGVVNPIPVAGGEGHYRLIAGFSRLEAARRAGQDAVPARILPEGTALLPQFFNELRIHITDHSLSVMEKARVLSIVNRCGTGTEQLRQDFLELMELPDDPRILEQVLSLLKLPVQTGRYISARGMGLKQCGMFLNTDDDLREVLIGLAAEYNIRAVELNALFELCRDIAGRENIRAAEVLTEPAVMDIREDDSLNRTQKLAAVKELLYRRRYPTLTGTNRTLEAHLKQADLPENIRLEWDRNLEMPGLVMHCRISTVRDAETVSSWFAGAPGRTLLQNMLNVI